MSPKTINRVVCSPASELQRGRSDHLGFAAMKKLLILALLIAIGVIAARRLREA
jgi:hypothetical protein